MEGIFEYIKAIKEMAEKIANDKAIYQAEVTIIKRECSRYTVRMHGIMYYIDGKYLPLPLMDPGDKAIIDCRNLINR